MQEPARYLVLIESDGAMLALLFDAGRRQLAEFDASSEEVAVMTRGLQPQRGATGVEWDPVLSGQGAAERAAARIYTLDV